MLMRPTLGTINSGLDLTQFGRPILANWVKVLDYPKRDWQASDNRDTACSMQNITKRLLIWNNKQQLGYQRYIYPWLRMKLHRNHLTWSVIFLTGYNGSVGLFGANGALLWNSEQEAKY